MVNIFRLYAVYWLLTSYYFFKTKIESTYSNNNIAPSSSIWENRAIDLSPPVCSVSHRGISFILSGKTHLLPLSLNMFSSMSPLVDLYFSFPQMPMLGQCASSVGGPYANDNSNNYLAEGKDPLLSEDTLKKNERCMLLNLMYICYWIQDWRMPISLIGPVFRNQITLLFLPACCNFAKLTYLSKKPVTIKIVLRSRCMKL